LNFRVFPLKAPRIHAAGMSLYPIFANLNQRPVLVIGGGAVGERKVAALRKTGAIITLVAPQITANLRAWAKAGLIRHTAEAFNESQLDRVWLVVAATDDRALNQRIAAEAWRRCVFVNVVDDAALSSFQVPALVDRSPLMIAISTGGAAPVFARLIRERIESLLDSSLGPLTDLVARYRIRIRTRIPDTARRRRFFERLFNGPVAAHLKRAQPLAAARALLAALRDVGNERAHGSVVLVGAGPGDPGLLTLNALRALNEADVILHDRLVSAEVLALARRDAELVDVGKQSGATLTSQEIIHSLLLEHARQGKRVVNFCERTILPTKWFPASPRQWPAPPTLAFRSPTASMRKAFAFSPRTARIHWMRSTGRCSRTTARPSPSTWAWGCSKPCNCACLNSAAAPIPRSP